MDWIRGKLLQQGGEAPAVRGGVPAARGKLKKRRNLQKPKREVPFSDIANAVAVNTMYIIPNGMKACTRSGVVYQFVVWGRQRLVGLINGQVV